MRARLWITGGVLALGVAVLLMSRKSGGVAVQVQGVTFMEGKGVCTVLVSNGTDRLHSFDVWSEYTESRDTWKRETLAHTAFNLPPRESHLALVAMPTNGRPRITVLCAPIHQGDLAYWRDKMVMLFGENPSRAYKVYVEVE